MATAGTAFGSGLNSSSGGELKLYLRCTGSTLDTDPPGHRPPPPGHRSPFQTDPLGQRLPWTETETPPVDR